MPIYHFHVHTDSEGVSPDRTGTELPDLTSAEREAVHFAGATIAEHAILGRRVGEWGMEVTDHAGSALFRLDFTVQPMVGTVTSHRSPQTAASH